jgi:hypothetical protein
VVPPNTIGLIALIDTAMNGFPMTDPLPMIALFAALWWFGTMRPKVCLTPEALVVRNPLWTRRIGRENVVSAKPSYFGVVIRRRAGRPCVAWALQKANVAEWTGRQTRADRAASLITRWAHGAL